MKKAVCILLAGIVILGSSGCVKVRSSVHSDVQQSANQEKQEKYTAVSEAYARKMASESFQDVADHFSSAVKAKLDAQTMKTTWDKTVSDYGSFIGIYSTSESSDSKYVTDIVTLKYENNGLQLTLIYNSSDEIDGIWMKQYTIPSDPASGDSFEETAIQVGDSSHPLDGILTLPKGIQNPPVAIMVQGSGQTDMNETIGANKPFQDIARGLAEKGIASIRYNKRYYQYSQLYTKTSTIKDEVLDDVSSAVALAKTNGSVNPQKIFVIGHSMGGMLAPKIADDNKDVAGIVSLAGSPRKLEDIMVDQNKKAGATDEQMKTISGQAAQIKNLSGKEDVTLLGVNSHYWYSLNQIDTGSIAKQLTIPMLFLQGSADFQVYPDVDYAQWQSLLGTNSNVTFHEYDHLNHLFMQSNGKTDTTEYDTAGHVDSNVIADIASFIQAN